MIQKYFKTTLCGAEKNKPIPKSFGKMKPKCPYLPSPLKKNHRMTDRLICKMVGTLTDQWI